MTLFVKVDLVDIITAALVVVLLGAYAVAVAVQNWKRKKVSP